MFFEKIRKEIQKRKFLGEDYKFLEQILEKDLCELKNEKIEIFKDELDFVFSISTQIHFNLLLNYDFKILWDILKTLDNNFWVVGGFIRDMIAGFKPKDIDLVTDMKIDDLSKVLEKHFDVKKVGAHFGVILVNIGDENFEIAELRSDKDNNGFKRGTLKTDFERRDFDINAIYFNLKTKLLEDKLDKTGIENALHRKFKFQGNPKERIKEDPLRVLRVYKLMQKGFTPDKKTLAETRKNFEFMIKNVNTDRLRDSFEKLIFRNF